MADQNPGPPPYPLPDHITAEEFQICSNPLEIQRWEQWQHTLNAYPLQVGMPARPRVFPLPAAPGDNVYDPTLPENQHPEDRDPPDPQQQVQQQQQVNPPPAGQQHQQQPHAQQANQQHGGPAVPVNPLQPPHQAHPGPPPAAMLGAAAMPNVLPIIFEVPHVNEAQVAPLSNEFKKKFGSFSGFSHQDPVGYIRAADQFFQERNIKALEAARIFTDASDSDALLWITQIQQLVPGECEPEDILRFRHSRYWSQQPYFKGREQQQYASLTWGTHEVTNLTRADSFESIPEVLPADAIPAINLGDDIPDPTHDNPHNVRAAVQADVREAVPAHSGRPYCKGRTGWARVRNKKQSNFEFRQDLPKLRAEPLVDEFHNLRQYLLEKYTKKADPELAEKYLATVLKQRPHLMTSVHLTLFKKVFRIYWQTKYSEQERAQLDGFGPYFQQARLELVLKSLNPGFRSYLEQAKAANPAINTIRSFYQLETLAQTWEQEVAAGIAFVKTCTPFAPHKLPFQGAKISALTMDQLFDMSEPTQTNQPTQDQQGQDGASAASASTNAILRGKGRGRGRGRGASAQPPNQKAGTPPPGQRPQVPHAKTNPKAADGFFEYHNQNGTVFFNKNNQPICNFCGIPSHPRSYCGELRKFRADNNQCQFHPQKGQLLSKSAGQQSTTRGRGGGSRGRGRGRGRGATQAVPQAASAFAAAPFPVVTYAPQAANQMGAWAYQQPMYQYQGAQAWHSPQQQGQFSTVQAAPTTAVATYTPPMPAQFAGTPAPPPPPVEESQDQAVTCPYCHKKVPNIAAFYKHADNQHPGWSSSVAMGANPHQ